MAEPWRPEGSIEIGLNQRAGANGPENPEMVHGNPEPLRQWKTTGLGGKSHA